MPLVSRHFEIMKAIRSAIIADTEIVAVVAVDKWRLQKKPLNRKTSWTAGGLISPLRRISPTHENRSDKIDFPVVVAVAWPKDQDLVAGMDVELALGERIENIFRDKGKTLAPYHLRNLSTTFTGTDFFDFEKVTVQPGDPFADGAFAAGFDAIISIVTVTCIANKTDSSLLGAP